MIRWKQKFRRTGTQGSSSRRRTRAEGLHFPVSLPSPTAEANYDLQKQSSELKFGRKIHSVGFQKQSISRWNRERQSRKGGHTELVGENENVPMSFSSGKSKDILSRSQGIRIKPYLRNLSEHLFGHHVWARVETWAVRREEELERRTERSREATSVEKEELQRQVIIIITEPLKITRKPLR